MDSSVEFLSLRVTGKGGHSELLSLTRHPEPLYGVKDPRLSALLRIPLYIYLNYGKM